MSALRQVWDEFTAWCARRVGEGQLDRAQRLIVAAIVLWFPAACLLVNRSDSVSLLILGGIGLVVWVRNGFRANLGRRDWLFVAPFIAFFFIAVLAFQLGIETDEGFRLLGRYLRFLFVLPVLMALRRYPPPAVVLWGGLGLGAFTLGLDAIFEFASTGGNVRPAGDTNVAILFGDVATLVTFAFAAGYVHIDVKLVRAGRWLVAACVLMGLLASFLSGTRGAWAAMPVLLILFLSCRHLLHPRAVLLSGFAILVLFTLLIYFPQTHVRERISFMIKQTRIYLLANADTSRKGAAPWCLDNREELRAWIDVNADQRAHGLVIDVVQLHGSDKEVLAAYGCSDGVAVYVSNQGKDLVYANLLRYQSSAERSATTRLLVKGRGQIGFSEQLGHMGLISGTEFSPITLTGPAQHGNDVVLAVSAGDSVWLVPEESYFGEYHYTFLNTPIAKRLEMWRTALRLFRAAPVIGIGTGAYEQGSRHLVETGQAAPDAGDYDHPHSDYFDALANRGAIGFLTLLLLLGMPAWLCKDGLDSHNPHCMGAALGGVLVATGFAIFGLTETMFIHSVTIGWYVIMTAVFFVCANARDGQGN